MPTILEQLDKDLLIAQKQQDKTAISTLRMLLASLKNARIAKMADLEEDDMVKALKSEIKKRKEAIVEYQKAGRQDLLDKEQAELAVLEKYLPAQMSEAEVRKAVENIVQKIENKENIGKVMGAVMAELKGQADGALVKQIVQEKIEG